MKFQDNLSKLYEPLASHCLATKTILLTSAAMTSSYDVINMSLNNAYQKIIYTCKKALFNYVPFKRVHHKLFKMLTYCACARKLLSFFIALMNNLCLKGNIIDQNQEKLFEGRGPGAGGPGPGKWAGGRGPGNSNRPEKESFSVTMY